MTEQIPEPWIEGVDSRQDIRFVIAAIEEGYPFLASKAKVWGNLFTDAKARVESSLGSRVSTRETWLLLKEVVASVRDGHTHVAGDVPPFSPQARQRAPLHLCHIDGRYYIQDAMPGHSIDPGDEVVAVQGHAVEQLEAMYARYEGHSTPHAQRAGFARSLPYVVDRYTDAASDERMLLVEVRGRDGGHRAVRLPWLGPFPQQPPHAASELFSHRWLCRRPAVGYLRMRGFFFPDRADQETICARLCAIMDDFRHASALVVDLRSNGGGSFRPMEALLSHLIPNPVPNFQRRWYVSDLFRRHHEWAHRYVTGSGFTRWEFDGEPTQEKILPASTHRLPSGVPVVAVTNVGTMSRCEELAFLLQETGTAVIVGETTAGAAAFPVQMKLPVTGWSFSMSVGELRSPAGKLLEGCGVLPDVPVCRTPEDLLSARDTYLERALEYVLVRAA